MNKMCKVLIVEDHPLIINNFKTAFSQVEKQQPSINFNITEALDCESANIAIENASRNGFFDLIVLDISLPPNPKNNLFSGEHLGEKLRLLQPEAKILVCTGYNDASRIKGIFTNINPEAFLLKGEINFSEIVVAIENLVKNMQYYSQTILQYLKEKSINPITLDAVDYAILHEIANGAKMKELLEIIPLTKSAIEKRKKAIRSKLNLSTNSDRDMILVAKAKNFL